jgi:hypothetical protein
MGEGAKGWLLSLREAGARVRLSPETLRVLLKAGKGPPGFKRPGSNRWLFWSRELDAWLESGGRVNQPADDHSQATGQTH